MNLKSNSNELAARKMWITGASSGIGAALAKQLLSEGCELVISARHMDALRPLVEAYPKTCFGLEIDVTDTNTLAEASKFIEAKLGYLDTVIINAGTCEYIDVNDFSASMVQRVMSVNVIGAAHTIEISLPLLRESKNGAHIVGISSMSTQLPLPRSEAYGSSKAALEYLLASLRVDLAAENIGVTIVRPGFVKTPLTDRNDFPMPFLQTADQAASTIIRGMAKQQRSINFPWPLVLIMKLIQILPEVCQIAILKSMSRNQAVKHVSD